MRIDRSTDIRRALRNRQRGFLLNPFVFGAGGGPNPDAVAFLANLVAYWPLDENAANPTYADAIGSHDLTQRNAAGSVNTSVNSGASFIQGTRYWNGNNTDDLTLYIPRADTGLDLGDFDHSFGGWFRTSHVASTTAFLMGRVGGNLATKLYGWLFVDGADSIIKARYSADGSTAAATASSGVAIDSTTAHLVVFTYNKTGGLLEIRLRKVGGSLAKTTVALGAAMYTGATNANFTIGEGIENDATFNASNRNAIKNGDECFFTLDAMTDSVFTYLFNTGNGKTLTQIQADAS
jgi:hypothetical protein